MVKQNNMILLKQILRLREAVLVIVPWIVTGLFLGVSTLKSQNAFISLGVCDLFKNFMSRQINDKGDN